MLGYIPELVHAISIIAKK
ncbi:MAG: hypothetical protein WBM44_09975 [Waterburya sp.]